MANYVTLYQVKDYLDIQSTTKDDGRLLEFIEMSSRLIEAYKVRSYEPQVETRKYDLPGSRRGAALGTYDAFYALPQMVLPLRLDEGLLECSELLNGDFDEIVSGDYVLEPANKFPKTRIRLRMASGVAWLPDLDGYVEQVIEVTGIWGNHDRYGQAWVDALDTVRDNPLTAGDTSISVVNADGLAGDGRAMRFQAGNLVRMGSEFALVLSVDVLTNTLEVARGVNGSTAAQQAQGTKIEIWRTQSTIAQACLRLVKWRYGQKDADDFDKSYVMGSGVVTVPARLPADVVQVLGAPGRMSV